MFSRPRAQTHAAATTTTTTIATTVTISAQAHEFQAQKHASPTQNSRSVEPALASRCTDRS
jgi:hypothetical protein